MIDYNEEYYRNVIARDSAVSYTDSGYWGKFFSTIAKHIVEEFNPSTVLDAGCALGYLVTALRDLGVEAYGVDISEYAITHVREDIKPYCAVGSLCDPLPEALPKKYDLVTCIEVLEHLTVEDGRDAIDNLCQYSDQVLFSSSPSDFEDITHINVQQREYWSEMFAKNHFYDAVLCRPTWLTAHAVVYRKNEDILRVISGYERYIRQTDAQIAQGSEPEYVGKVYSGTNENEAEAFGFRFRNGVYFQQRVPVPKGCKFLRFDPVEGYGCLIRNLNVRSDSAQLEISKTNGCKLDNLLLFKSVEPRIYFEKLPQDAHWVEVEAEVFPFNNAAWIKLYDLIENQIAFGQKKTVEAEEKRLRLLDLQTLVDEQSERIATLENKNESLIAKQEEAQQQLQDIQTLVDDQAEEITSLEKGKAELEKVCDDHCKEIQDYSNLVAYERSESERITNDLNRVNSDLNKIVNELISSTSWKFTRPFRFIMRILRRTFALPIKVLKLIKKSFVSLRQYGLKVTLKKIQYKITGKQEVIDVPIAPAPATVFPPSTIVQNSVTNNPVDPIQTVLVNEPVKRLNLVTDTINSDSLLGGVATALIVATEFANSWDCELRIITRNTETNPLNYENIMKISGIKPAKRVSFYSDYDRFTKSVDYKMELSPDDIFFATSWWSAMVIAGTTIRKRFFYIIQEVETFFYNYGGEHMLCEQMMHNPNIDFIVNSGYLNQYFEKNEPQIVANGCYFEPAFPAKLYGQKVFTRKERYKLFFYSRPNNPRNLYTVGVEMLKKAVEKGIIDTNEWDIYCVGQNAPIICFSNGAQSKNLGQLTWTEYAQFLADVDLGLCLMYTPHPSYPPFDVACSGGVVLSNKMLNKTSFDMCKNIILADLDEESFMVSFTEAIALAKNMELRKKNYEENTIPRDWHSTLEDTISYMKGKCENV